MDLFHRKQSFASRCSLLKTDSAYREYMQREQIKFKQPLYEN